jgi:PBP1b-binding outer membrane lipoprotein LpoB
MKKYIVIIAAALFLSACGNQGKTENTDEMTPEQEVAFVEEEIEVIDESVKGVETEVDDSEQKVEELLKEI